MIYGDNLKYDISFQLPFSYFILYVIGLSYIQCLAKCHGVTKGCTVTTSFCDKGTLQQI